MCLRYSSFMLAEWKKNVVLIWGPFGKKDLPFQTVTAEGDFCKVFQEEISISWVWRNRATIWLRNIKICCCLGKKKSVGWYCCFSSEMRKYDDCFTCLGNPALIKVWAIITSATKRASSDFSLHFHKIFSVSVQLACICAKTYPADQSHTMC